VRKKKESLEKERAALKERMERVQAKPPPTVSETSQMNASMEEELRKLEAQLKGGSDIASLQAKKDEVMVKHRKAVYGVDLCFMMDCTYSMDPWIEITKKKILDLAQNLKNIPARVEPTFRVAFLGYRDLKDKEQFVFVDFFELSDTPAVIKFQKVLEGTAAEGGNDFPENIAGAMKYVLEKVSWRASTKLVIHFTDAPCHGKKYHDYRDDYPNGDPNGLVPEELLLKFAGKSITYYFGEIGEETRKMTNIFSNFMRENQQGLMFEVVPMEAGVDSFLPKVINSVSQSMTRSGLFGME